MSLQEHHDVLHILLLLPGFLDLGHTSLADVRHFEQTVNIVLDDLEGLQSEMRHNLLGKLRADTFYQSTAQIFLDTYDSCRQFLSP